MGTITIQLTDEADKVELVDLLAEAIGSHLPRFPESFVFRFSTNLFASSSSIFSFS